MGLSECIICGCGYVCDLVGGRNLYEGAINDNTLLGEVLAVASDFFFSFFLASHLFSSLLCSLSLVVVVTQIRGHTADSPPPLPTSVRALYFYREKTSALSSLVDSRRTTAWKL